MALKIKLKQVAGTPTTSDLENGEIAHNTSANTLHIRIGDTIHSVSSSGGGGGSTLTVQDEGSSLSTAATTLNFVGSGVTASGTGATKTITISGGGSVDLSAVDQDIVPDANNTRDLGSSSKKFAELHLSGNTIFLGNAKIKATDAGDLTDADDNKIGVTNEEGAPVRLVPLFTAAGGLTTPAKRLTFKASSARDRVFKDTFTKANGDSVTATRATQLFEF
jgi:hypothetical protein